MLSKNRFKINDDTNDDVKLKHKYYNLFQL